MMNGPCTKTGSRISALRQDDDLRELDGFDCHPSGDRPARLIHLNGNT
jgi:hypothetical protein